MKKKSRMPQIGEAVFCIIYLVFDIFAAWIFLTHVEGREYIKLFGILTLVLAGGDAFHLVPRIINAFKETFDGYEFWAGLGLMISSITMTIFYLLLYQVWDSLFPNSMTSGIILATLYGCAFLRIILCLFPQNNWFKKEGNPKWGIYRNVPFVVVGLIMILLYANVKMYAMAIAILISFCCYMPVVLWGKKHPMVGMLMMPKTAAYMWMIGIGLSLL